MDMGMGYHQLPLDRQSKDRSIFQTHEGLHYFGPSSATGIFQNEVAKALRGVPGCTTIHDNILVGGKDYEDHRRNLRATLERCKEKGITLKLKKSTFCRQEVLRELLAKGAIFSWDKRREGASRDKVTDLLSRLVY